MNRVIEKFNELKEQLVICDYNQVKRFIGVGEDNLDYFYIFWNGRVLSYSSPLCPVISLKGKIDDKDYNELIRIANLNHYDLINNCEMKKEVEEKIRKEILQDNILLTEINLNLT